MFEKPTVFILGAGASCHYGYPSGEKLVKDVKNFARRFIANINNFSNGWLTENHYSVSPQLFSSILPKYIAEKFKKFDSSSKALDHVLNDCKKIELKLNQVDPPVIDHFLDRNPSLREIGKILIAAVLLEAERNSINRNFESDNWLRFIFHHMMIDCNEPAEFISKNNLKFVTFNYDVSLERQIYKSMIETEFFSGNSIPRQFFSEDRFIHVYGKIGKFPYDDITEGPSERNEIFKDKFLLDLAYDASSGINTIAPLEKLGNVREIGFAKEAIDAAEKIYILGYGFDRINSSNVGLDNAIFRDNIVINYGATKKTKHLYFTNYGNKNIISKRIGQMIIKSQDLFLPPASPIYSENGKVTRFHFEMSTKDVYGALSEDFDFAD